MNDLAVGAVIRWSAGGSTHVGTITKLGRHRHVHVDTSPLVIPPNWILADEDETDAQSSA